MKTTIRLAIAATMMAFLAACSSVKLEDETAGKGPAPIESRDGAGGATAGGASGRAVEPVTVGATDPLNDPNSPLAKRSIYFDFDSFVVKDEFRGTVEAHARYLLANNAKRVVIQGNTDER
ncbi:MAG TPA: peptidoglycan-associated lipoprotein, partial [Burkholderiaceae bacterium]|nr:peptidoglycan-associated lipoprotein [Burkholderiaceae bacterium]